MERKWFAAFVAIVVGLVLAAPAGAEPPAARNFVAHLSGDEEVFTGDPSPSDSNATGQFVAKLNDTETGLTYRLIVANIENVVAAHIHLGVEGVNGPIVAFLAGPFPAGGGRIDGNLGTGTITAANLVGPLAGHLLADLVTHMRNGETYVNAHTNDGVPPVNTGPGDFPGGEVRGQIGAAGP